jgi:hypothetical protein
MGIFRRQSIGRYLQTMDSKSRSKVTPLFQDQAVDDDAAAAGWDPYIFSIIASDNTTFTEERRRVPRVNTPARRRALLISKGRRRR